MTQTVGAIVALVTAMTMCTAASAAVATRHYDFEEGTAGESTIIVQDITKDLFIESDSTGLWEGGHIWIEVAGSAPRPVAAGSLVDAVEDFALVDPPLEALDGTATFQDVKDGTAFDSPALGSTLALSFDGTGFFDDVDLGSRGVYIDRVAYNSDDDANGDNQTESFNLITQGWVYPSSAGQGTLQTVWQAGREQGSVNISEDGFWEFRDLGSVDEDLDPDARVAVAFDTWTHLGIRRGGNGAEVFVNGVQVDGDINPDPGNFFNGFATRIALGGRIEEEDLVNGFVGLVDDFKILGTADFSWDPMADLDYWKVDNPSCTPLNDLLGDLDGVDGVAFADFLILSGNFGMQVDSYEEGDIDCDGEVAFSDFLILSGNFGETGAAAAAVPEPAGFALLIPALALLCVRKRR